MPSGVSVFTPRKSTNPIGLFAKLTAALATEVYALGPAKLKPPIIQPEPSSST